MEIIGNRLMASSIEEVIENPRLQSLKIKIMFPVDFANNIYEERFLIFKKVIYYSVDEIIIPLGRIPMIHCINHLGKTKKYKSDGPKGEKMEIIRNKIEIQTNIGKRIIECESYIFSVK